MTITIDLTADLYALNKLMEFDHVIEVHEDGTVSEPSAIYAPDVFEVHENGTVRERSNTYVPDVFGWELLQGYSGQHGYSGPVMHPSEFIGGGLARDILATPGVYVAVLVIDLSDDTDDNVMGWAVARMTKDEV